MPMEAIHHLSRNHKVLREPYMERILDYDRKTAVKVSLTIAAVNGTTIVSSKLMERRSFPELC